MGQPPLGESRRSELNGDAFSSTLYMPTCGRQGMYISHRSFRVTTLLGAPRIEVFLAESGRQHFYILSIRGSGVLGLGACFMTSASCRPKKHSLGYKFAGRLHWIGCTVHTYSRERMAVGFSSTGNIPPARRIDQSKPCVQNQAQISMFHYLLSVKERCACADRWLSSLGGVGQAVQYVHARTTLDSFELANCCITPYNCDRSIC